MGNDGGSIPTRRELVKEAARNPTASQLKEALREHLEHYWATCPLSHKELLLPIVSDSIGNLYNKDAVIKYLLPGDDTEGISSKADCDGVLGGRVKSLRDVVEVKFAQEEDEKTTQGQKQRWICPVTSKELGPNVRSVYLVPCGHAFSEEAIREMKGDKCLQCNESYVPENVIPILPTKDEEKGRLVSRIQELSDKGLCHSLKKQPGSSKKRKKNDGMMEATDSAGVIEKKTPAIAAGSVSQNYTSQSESNNGTSTPKSSGLKNSATAMLTARVLEEENQRNKRRKAVGANENLQSLFTSDSKKGQGKDSDFMTRGYSIPSTSRR